MGTISGMNYTGVGTFRNELSAYQTRFKNIIRDLDAKGADLKLVYTGFAADSFRNALAHASESMDSTFTKIMQEFDAALEDFKQQYGLREEELEARKIIEFEE